MRVYFSEHESFLKYSYFISLLRISLTPLHCFPDEAKYPHLALSIITICTSCYLTLSPIVLQSNPPGTSQWYPEAPISPDSCGCR